MRLEFDEKWLADYCRRTGQPVPEDLRGAAQPKRRKYGNTPTTRDGRTFDSKHEAEVYDELMLLTKSGDLLGVYCQHPFRLPGGVVYRADFVALLPGGKYRVIDAKSEATQKDRVYRLKKRQMRECLGITIEER